MTAEPLASPTETAQRPFGVHRYMIAMATLILVDIGVAGTFVLVTGRYEVVPEALAVNLAVLGVLNLGIAWLLARPVAHWIKRPGDAALQVAGQARLRALPTYSGLLGCFLGVVQAGVNLGLGTFIVPGSGPAVDLPAPVLLAAALWYPLVYAGYYGFFSYFVVHDVTAGMRRRLEEAGVARFQAGEGRLVVRLAIAFGVVAVLPNLLIAFDLTIFRDVRAAQGLTPSQTVLLDLLASLFAVSVSLFFLARSLLRPLRALLDAVTTVRDGALPGKASVTTEDEIGVLTDRFNDMVEGLREGAFVRETFGRYVSGTVAETILRERGRPRSQACTATVMFTDIEGFTTLSERQSPQQTIDLLNDYFEVLLGPIERNGGTVINFIGDAVCAVFNVPDADTEHASNAVRAALEIQAALADKVFEGGITLKTRLGINTGHVVAGIIGGEARLGYTVYGDAVNLAARLEPLNKQFGTRILASEATVSLAGPVARFESLGLVPIRGRAQKVSVYAVAPSGVVVPLSSGEEEDREANGIAS